MKRILLITSIDDTYRKPLLETQGFHVDSMTAAEAEEKSKILKYDVVLITTESDIATMLNLCRHIKAAQPGTRVGVLAQRAEYVPGSDHVDAVFRNQYSPGKFLASIRKLVDLSPGQKAAAAESDD